MMTVKAIAKQAEKKRDFYFHEAVAIFERIKKKIERANKKKSVVFKLYDVLDILNKNGFSTISAETETDNEKSKTERNSFVLDKEEALGFLNLQRDMYKLCVKKGEVYLEFPSKARHENEFDSFVLSNYAEYSGTSCTTGTKSLVAIILDFWSGMSELGVNALKARIDLLNAYECLLDVFLTTIDSFHEDYMAFAERQVKF